MSEEVIDRKESCVLYRTLKRMIGDDVSIDVLGGFKFQGNLINVDDDLAALAPLSSCAEIMVYPPGSNESLNGIRSVIVNLCALTSVGKPLGIL